MLYKRKFKKGILITGTIAFFVLVVGFILSKHLYLPGINFWWRFCSINVSTYCFWLDVETQKLIEEPAGVDIKVTGFDSSNSLFAVNGENLNGVVELGGYEMDFEESVVMMNFLHRTFGDEYRQISCTEGSLAIEEKNGVLNSRPEKGKTYIFIFPKEKPEYICVKVLGQNNEILSVGYCGEGLESAESAKQFFEARGWGQK